MRPEDAAIAAAVVKARTGVVLDTGNLYPIESRLLGLARAEGLGTVEALAAALRAGPPDRLCAAVVDTLAPGETRFFRDKPAFERLADTVLPALAPSRTALRVWSAACGTGQEPYSLAMLFDELAPTHPRLAVDICASDISERALAKARAGVFSRFEVQQGLSITRLLRHFDPVDDAWRVKGELRQAVRWRAFNLLDDPRPLGTFDLVLCRNILPHLEAPARARALGGLAAVLAPDGFLLLGAEESQACEGFIAVEGGSGLWRRQEQAVALGSRA